MAATPLKSISLPSKELSFTNLIYVSPSTFRSMASGAPKEALAREKSLRCEVKGFIFNAAESPLIDDGFVAFGKMHRNCAKIKLEETVSVSIWKPPYNTIAVALIQVGTFPVRNAPPVTLTDEILDSSFKPLINDQTLTVNQIVTINHNNGTSDVVVTLTVESIEVSRKVKSTSTSKSSGRNGIVTDNTEFVYSVSDESSVTLRSKKIQQRQIFDQDFNLEKLGIGGLDKEFSDIFRRAFASRIFPPHVVAEMGINHVRGMLLYGPPGTGKTLIARQIGKALKANEPKIVNGPEVLNKYVGESEANIRNLFADAEAEQKKKGDNSALHIVIFDEIDAICKTRGKSSGGTGVNDSVVNQLLSKIDGVDSLNNILLIGMTNRLDMIDEALIRPGRLEVHLEIGLPDEKGRVQILNIHTAKMTAANRLDSNVDVLKLAKETKNYSGAEIEGLVRSAASYAFNRQVNINDLANPIDSDSIRVTREDFESALEEVKPAFGVQEAQLKSSMPHGIIPFSDEFRRLQRSLFLLAGQVCDSAKTPLLSVLLTGAKASGKTALASYVALKLLFPFTKLVTPDTFIGQTEAARIDALSKVFDDAYKSRLSFVILDSIERLLDYTPIGPRFSNSVLQALYVLIERQPPKEGRHIFIIATTSDKSFVEHCGLAGAFSYTFNLPLVSTASSIRTVLEARNNERGDFPQKEIDLVCQSIVEPIGIKRLLTVTETAAEFCKQTTQRDPSQPSFIRSDIFLDCLRVAGVQ